MAWSLGNDTASATEGPLGPDGRSSTNHTAAATTTTAVPAATRTLPSDLDRRPPSVEPATQAPDADVPSLERGPAWADQDVVRPPALSGGPAAGRSGRGGGVGRSCSWGISPRYRHDPR